MSKKTTLAKSSMTFVFAVSAVLAFRWIFFEPFVIPSGSMIPSLLINDHIVVSKFSYGVRLPFTQKWLWGPQLPARGEVVVFRSVETPSIYMIKRVIGLPGDSIAFNEMGQMLLNGELNTPVDHEEIVPDDAFQFNDVPEDFVIQRERQGEHDHLVMYDRSAFRFAQGEHVVPDGHVFVVGDNRDRSRDSRFWGDLPIDHLLGKAQYVWLSCSKTIPKINILCDVRFIRWHRFFHKIK